MVVAARSRGRVAAVVVAAGLVLGGCADGAEQAEEPLEAPVAAAETICPIMWAWVKDVGATFNAASRAVGDIEAVAQRRKRWMDAFDRIEELNNQLVTDVSGHREDPILGPIVAEIERDVPASLGELDDIRDLFTDSPEKDNERHQLRTSQVIVRIEKVIDLPKPELAGLDRDGTLIPAFQTVPSCQQSVKDVDDGRIQANG